jgi:polyphosphate glucokinase
MISSGTLSEPPVIAIGVDVGGTGIKGGAVDLGSGSLTGHPIRLPTPAGAHVTDVVPVIAEVVRRVVATSPGIRRIGVALSGDVRDGRHTTGVNLHDSWVGAPARDLIEAATGGPVAILNDADAAALGEARYGAAAGMSGVVLVLTFGTGIGSGLLTDGHLVPNTGLGQLPFRGGPAELLLSAVARERHRQSWSAWAADVSEYLGIIDLLLRPDLLVIGGGVVNAWDRFAGLLRSPCELVPAALGDAAGIVGAARYAATTPGDT